MLRQEQSDLLTRTGPGTPMGGMFRSYWIPALLAEELPENDCPPVRVKLLSERLVAFRDTEGRRGLIDEFCAHRGVSLWFGRNEECGLRCAYHGWKYDVSGQCTEGPSEPEASRFAKRIKLQCTRWSSAEASSGRTWDRRKRNHRCPNGNYSPCHALRRSPQAPPGIELAPGDGGRDRFQPCVVPAPGRPRLRPAVQGGQATIQPERPTACVRSRRERRRPAHRRPPQRGRRSSSTGGSRSGSCRRSR